MSKWTPEPWALEQNGAAWNLRSLDRVDPFMYLIGLTHNNPGEHTANAKRIVECVNGCAGIEDPETTVPELVAACNQTRAAMDHFELSAGLTQIGIVLNKMGKEQPAASSADSAGT